MDKILESLSDPSWWFTAVVVAVLAGIAGGILKDRLDRWLARRSANNRERRSRAIALRARSLRAESRDGIEVLAATVGAWTRIFLGAGAFIYLHLTILSRLTHQTLCAHISSTEAACKNTTFLQVGGAAMLLIVVVVLVLTGVRRMPYVDALWRLRRRRMARAARGFQRAGGLE